MVDILARNLRIRSVTRAWLAGVVILLAIPLTVATRLTPKADGLGTHQQLGLPPCTVRLLWGVRCPACGMTTSWSHFVRGELASGLRASVAGTLLAVSACVGLTVAMIGVVSGRMPGRRWAVLAVWGMTGILLTAVAEWLVRIT